MSPIMSGLASVAGKAISSLYKFIEATTVAYTYSTQSYTYGYGPMTTDSAGNVYQVIWNSSATTRYLVKRDPKTKNVVWATKFVFSYSPIGNLSIDGSYIYVFCTGFILVFDLNGNYVKKIAGNAVEVSSGYAIYYTPVIVGTSSYYANYQWYYSDIVDYRLTANNLTTGASIAVDSNSTNSNGGSVVKVTKDSSGNVYFLRNRSGFQNNSYYPPLLYGPWSDITAVNLTSGTTVAYGSTGSILGGSDNRITDIAIGNSGKVYALPYGGLELVVSSTVSSLQAALNNMTLKCTFSNAFYSIKVDSSETYAYVATYISSNKMYVAKINLSTGNSVWINYLQFPTYTNLYGFSLIESNSELNIVFGILKPTSPYLPYYSSSFTFGIRTDGTGTGTFTNNTYSITYATATGITITPNSNGYSLSATSVTKTNAGSSITNVNETATSITVTTNVSSEASALETGTLI